jgi:hypothetical protein
MNEPMAITETWPAGAVIKEVHRMTDAEASKIGWDKENYSGTEMTAVIVLEGGGWIVASADPEMNRGGCLAAEDPDGNECYVWPA